MIKQSIFLGLGMITSLAANAEALSKGVKLGSFTLRPSFSVNVQQDDNLFAENSSPTDATLTEYIPELRLANKKKRAGFEAFFKYIDGSYDDSPSDDYTDSYFGTSGNLQLSRRSNLQLNAAFNKKHDPRKSEDLAFAVQSAPDEFDETRAGIDYTFGRRNARGRLVFSLGYTDKEYTNTVTAEDDREVLSTGVIFYLRTSNRTNLLLDFEHVDSNYKDDPIAVAGMLDTLDSKHNQLFLGFKWDLTAKTAGEIRLGYADRDFDDSDRNDFSGFSWRVDASWDIDSKNRVKFSSTREDKESDDGISGGYIDLKSYLLAWERRWNNKVKSEASLSLREEEYIDFFEEREDELLQFTFRVDYQLARWASIGFSVDQIERESSSPRDLGYERERLTLHLRSML